MASTGKITYISLGADDPEVNAAFDNAIAEVGKQLGRAVPLHVAGKTRAGASSIESLSPTDTRVVVARVASGTAEDVRDAVAAARAAFPAWSARPWAERAQLLERAAETIRRRRYELSAWLIHEMGKNRIEALGEVEETADLISYYNEQMRLQNGYVHEMNRLVPTDRNTSVLRPYGVWAVVSPWNFPFALFGAPIAAALLTGNTVVAKPSSDTPLIALKFVEILEEAGLPPGTISCIPGGGRVVGDALTKHPDVDGVTFTGSYDVGFALYKSFATKVPKPCITEMGGKNPAIVMETADVDKAVQGVYRSAFGMNGHKCSACSRVYVHQTVAPAFIEKLVAMTNATKIGSPLEKGVFAGPLATKASYEDYQRFVALARAAGPDVVRAGGATMTEGAFAHGYFVRPTVVSGLPKDHELMRRELFVPLVAVTAVDGIDEALALANDTDFGLTAGLFSRAQPEIDAFLQRIEAGVIYVNRAAGATTGAWPGVQPFGGWKGSGSTGKNIGGPHTLQCYLREQSRTICE